MSERKGKTGRRARTAPAKIDVTAILTKPVKVGQHGREQRMTPFEVGLRALVTPAPPPPKNGGVRIWSGMFDLKFNDDIDEKWAEACEMSRRGKSKGGNNVG